MKSMPDFYRDGPPTPVATDSDNLPFHDLTSNMWRRPSQLMSSSASIRRNNSATETTASSVSAGDLRTPVRFADPLAHFSEYGRGDHPSPYLREQNGERKGRIYSEFIVGTRNSVKQVDYRVPDQNRPLEVRVNNRSLYIDPKAAKDVSPQISAFLLREYAAGHKSSVEPKLDDLHYDEVLEAVRAVCPTDLGLFATPVTASTFSSLARMSRIFQVQKLKQACELFVARLPLKLDELNAAFAANLLNDAFKYGMNARSKVRLLQGVIGLIEAEIRDPSQLPTYSSKNPNVLPVIGNLIDAAVEEHKKGRLNHGKMLNEARLKIPCRSCRIEEPVSNMQPALNELQVCSRCRQTTCRKCLNRPCASLVEQFMDKFAKDYAQK